MDSPIKQLLEALGVSTFHASIATRFPRIVYFCRNFILSVTVCLFK